MNVKQFVTDVLAYYACEEYGELYFLADVYLADALHAIRDDTIDDFWRKYR